MNRLSCCLVERCKMEKTKCVKRHFCSALNYTSVSFIHRTCLMHHTSSFITVAVQVGRWLTFLFIWVEVCDRHCQRCISYTIRVIYEFHSHMVLFLVHWKKKLLLIARCQLHQNNSLPLTFRRGALLFYLHCYSSSHVVKSSDCLSLRYTPFL